jgi:Helix-turn-helix domain of resolvase
MQSILPSGTTLCATKCKVILPSSATEWVFRTFGDTAQILREPLIRCSLQEFERELIRERQREGIAIAKREGKYRGGKPSLTPARAAELRRRVVDGDSKAALAREFGISRDTLYRYVPVKKRRAGKLAK